MSNVVHNTQNIAIYTEKKAAKDQRFDPVFLLSYSAFSFTNLVIVDTNLLMSPGH